MTTATQANRGARITSPFGEDVLLFRQMVDVSRLGQPFRVDLELLSEKGDLEADQILGEPVVIELDLPDGRAKRHFHGLVTEFAWTGYEERFHEYQATVRPWFWFLTRTADCRIFQKKSVPDIFEEVVKECGFSDFELKLNGSHQQNHSGIQEDVRQLRDSAQVLVPIAFFIVALEIKIQAVQHAAHPEIVGVPALREEHCFEGGSRPLAPAV